MNLDTSITSSSLMILRVDATVAFDSPARGPNASSIGTRVDAVKFLARLAGGGVVRQVDL